MDLSSAQAKAGSRRPAFGSGWRRLALGAVGLLAVTTALPACSTPKPPVATVTPKATPTATAVTNTRNDINAQDRATLGKGGKLRLAISTFPETFNPLHVEGSSEAAATVRAPMTARFFKIDAAGRLTYDPNWLQGEPEVSADGTTVTYRLNPKAAWNDGTLMATGDFVATWQACRGADPAFECASATGFNRIKDIKQGSDTHTVVVTFDTPYPDWRTVFRSGPLRAASVADAATFNTGWAELTGHDGWFSGPFKIGTYDLLTQTMTLVRNPAWWGQPALLDEIQIKVIAKDQQLNAYLTGAIDVLSVGVDVEAFTRASQVTAGVVRSTESTTFRELILNSKSPALADPAVRRGIVQGLDRVRLANVDLAGLKWQPKELNSQLFLLGQAGYVDMAAETGLKYDPQAAAATLTAAGWTLGADGYRSKAGQPLKVRFTRLAGIKASENTGLQLTAQLKTLGIKVDVVEVPANELTPTLQGGDWDLIAYTTQGDPFPYDNASDLFNSKSDDNHTGFASDAVDAELDKLNRMLDPVARRATALTIERLTWGAAVVLPLYQRPEQVAVSSRLANFGAFGLATPVWEDVGFTK